MFPDGATPHLSPVEDPYLWLEEVSGEQALDWVRSANARTAAALEGGEAYESLELALLAILDSKAKIPFVEKRGAYFYNLWRDEANPRGLFRRTTLEEFRRPEPAWETVLDLDALGAVERQGWVFQGSRFLEPDCRFCLVSLSPGGSDACVVREFDVEAKRFVADGFELSLAKSQVSWIDRDTLFVGTDFGPGSMTASGYPRIAKRWKRGTPLDQAETVFEGDVADMVAGAYHDATPGYERDFLFRKPSFFSEEIFLLRADGTRQRIETPADAETQVHRDWLTLKLRTSWVVGGTTYPAGALLASRFEDFLAGRRDLAQLFEPSATTSLESAQWTRNRLILNVLEDVKNRLSVLTPGGWEAEPLRGAPACGHLTAYAVDADASDDYFMTVTDFLTPDTLLLGSPGSEPEPLKAMPAFFDASGLAITQHFTASADGTRVPYFLIARKDLVKDGTNPTLLTGYGGFEVSMLPRYSGLLGRGWLAQGGVLAVANIRGGGEYGPRWHQAALKQNRPRAFEDFAAVATDLAARGVTSPGHLGILGGSNGGLLVGNMLTRYPSLFGATVCQVPLLDMKRYSRLLAGASWMEEYGDPDQPEEWAFLRTFSPYQNVRPGLGCPPTLFMTTTLDDRVHPGHARKMYARMKDMGYDVHYFENIEGGHGAGADNRQMAHAWALAYTFLARTLAGRAGTLRQ